jgi:2-polyprenyl-3-methyl-5-hydroxy-6-metoxy-1,4-benzoquinol methylase
MQKEPLNIINANRKRYSDPKVVDKYLEKKHHKIRVEVSVELLKDAIDHKFLNRPPNQIKILELASSTGTIAKKIVKNGYDLIATDLESNVLEMIKSDKISTKQIDATQKFPFKDQSFHGIYMGELIEHIFDTNFLLSECHRVLKTNGIIVITTPNLATLIDRAKFLFGKSPKQVDPLHEYRYLHIRPFTFKMLEKRLFQAF